MDTSKRLLKTYHNARKSWEAWCFMSNLHLAQNKPEIKKSVNENQLFYYLRYLALKDMHIELYKIIKKSHTNESNIISILEEKESPECEERLKEFKELTDETNSIIKARNKFYAHLDKDYSNYLKEFSGIEQYYKVFEWIEKSIITVGLETELMAELECIPSRNEFELCTQHMDTRIGIWVEVYRSIRSWIKKKRKRTK
jgi:hypothetical protein